MVKEEMLCYSDDMLLLLNEYSIKRIIDELWEESSSKREFEDAVLNTRDKNLLASKAYVRLFKQLPVYAREQFVRAMFERVLSDKKLNPQTAICKFTGGEYTTVLLIDDDTEIALDEVNNPLYFPYSVVVFDYRNVLSDPLKCTYPFNKNMRADDGGAFYFRLNENSSARLAFRSFINNDIEKTSIKLLAGRYFACSVLGYVFIERYE